MLSEQAKRKLVEEHVPLACIVVKKMLPMFAERLEYGDLLSAACIGMMDAAERYDPGRGCKFSSFAEPRIRGAIVDEARRLSKYSRCRNESRKYAEAAKDRHYARTGDRLSDDEVPPPPPNKCGNTLALARAPVEVPMGLTPKGEAVEYAAPPARQLDDLMDAVCRGLSRIERAVITLTYREGLPMSMTGKALGYTESRVCQIHADLMRRLRENPAAVAALEAMGRKRENAA